MIRLFTGLAIPRDISADLGAFARGLQVARWIEPSDYHITLQFAGNIEEEVATETGRRIVASAKSRQSTFVLDSLLVFGGNKPRSVVVGVRTTPSLVDLQASHDRIMINLKYRSRAGWIRDACHPCALNAISPDAVADYVDSRGFFARAVLSRRVSHSIRRPDRPVAVLIRQRRNTSSARLTRGLYSTWLVR